MDNNIENNQNQAGESPQYTQQYSNPNNVPPPYYQMQYGDRGTGTRTSGFHIAALVLGILSIVFSCCYGIGIIFGIIGFICALIGKRDGWSGINIAGLVCSIIGIIFSAIVIAILYVYYQALIAYLRLHPQYLDHMELYSDSEFIRRVLMEYFNR